MQDEAMVLFEKVFEEGLELPLREEVKFVKKRTRENTRKSILLSVV